MPKIHPFQKHADQYETWFERNRWVYEAELRAVKALIPETGHGVEIGVGTGRFAAPLGIKIGVEPSTRMKEMAQKRGIQVFNGVAEKLPFNDCELDFILMVTTVCFVDDINKAFQEAYRVLSKGGFLIVGEVDRNSPIGQTYLKHQNENVFYKEAAFFSVDEVVKAMKQAGLRDFVFRQTIFHTLPEVTENEPVKPGYGQGSFVVIRGKKHSC
jgi:SAM-dependent methyltransferase